MTGLSKLRLQMEKKGIDIYIHPNTDPHQSEYISEHYRFIKYLSGFTGSNATILVTQSEAFLWTDGRYFIQANKEIKESGFKLKKQNIPGEPTVSEMINSLSKEKSYTLGIDGRLFTKNDFEKYKDICEKNAISCKFDFSPMEEIWPDREKLPCTKPWLLDVKYAGKSVKAKLCDVRAELKKSNVDGILLNELCDIAWVLNIRANDIPYVPVMYSYLYISMDEVILFSQNASDIDIDCINSIHPLNDIYTFVSSLFGKKILVDPDAINIALLDKLDKEEIVYKPSPIKLMRAIKNEVEIDNLYLSHTKDGVALTKMIYFLKEYSKGKIDERLDEVSVANKLQDYRKRADDYVSDSFDAIVAYGSNAAMMHYSATEESKSDIDTKGFLLIDSGGHYLSGTTDVTRTISLGELSIEEKKEYTRVLKAHLRLMDAKFPKGATGENLDILARQVFWEDGLDYLSGTGHGVGYLLSVHEGPNNIRWRYTKKPEPIVPGMVTTDEPGMYIEGKFGIRIENELLCVPYMTTEYGEYYRFEPITFVPYDREAIIEDMLTDSEKSIFNSYNKMVYEKLEDHLSCDEKNWLKNATKSI